MIKRLVFTALCLVAVSCTHFRKEINLETLLDEMIDRDVITRFPECVYTQKQVSSYDRRSIAPDQEGWFANVDGGGYERLDTVAGRVEKVLFDEKGPGVITRIWMTTNTKKGVLRFYFDDAEEAQVKIDAYDMDRFPAALPDAFSLTHTHYVKELEGVGGNTFFLPIPYAESCKVTFEEPDMSVWLPRYYHVNYRTYAPGTKVKTFTMDQLIELEDKLEQVSEMLYNPADYEPGEKMGESELLESGESIELELPSGVNAVRDMKIAFKNIASCDYDKVVRGVDVEGYFDGKECISVPLADFFGAGMGAPEVDSWYLECDAKGSMQTRFVMPYRESGVLKLINKTDLPLELLLEVIVGQYNWTDNSLYFHASHRTEMGIPLNNNYDTNENLDWNFMTINGRGVYVGDLISLYNYAIDWYGEGDEKIWVDDDTFPSHFGTGTEDYYNCSWAPVVPFLTPYGGAPRADESSSHGYNAYLRTRNLDVIPFNELLRFDIEMLSWHIGSVDYYTTSYWYGDYDCNVNNTKY